MKGEEERKASGLARQWLSTLDTSPVTVKLTGGIAGRGLAEVGPYVRFATGGSGHPKGCCWRDAEGWVGVIRSWGAEGGVCVVGAWGAGAVDRQAGWWGEAW